MLVDRAAAQLDSARQALEKSGVRQPHAGFGQGKLLYEPGRFCSGRARCFRVKQADLSFRPRFAELFRQAIADPDNGFFGEAKMLFQSSRVPGALGFWPNCGVTDLVLIGRVEGALAALVGLPLLTLSMTQLGIFASVPIAYGLIRMGLVVSHKVFGVYVSEGFPLLRSWSAHGDLPGRPAPGFSRWV